jgi:uncharacterized membrane protein
MPSQMHAEYFVIDHFGIDIIVSDQGYFDVIETIQLTFSEKRRGIVRAIPVIETSNGERIKVDISNIKIDGWESKIYQQGKYKKIRIGSPDVFINGSQEYKIRYRVNNAFFFFSDFTEFHWNLIGTEWDVPIEQVSYTIELPKATDILDFAAFSGSENISENKVSIEQDGKRLIGTNQKRLTEGEGLTVAIKLTADSINRLNLQSEKKPFSDFFFPIPAAIAALFIGFWRKKGRNQKIDLLPNDIYYPPEGIAAAELGVLIDDRANDRDVLSLIPEWGRKNYIRLKNTGESKGDIKSDMFIEKTGDLPGDAPKYQRVLFDALFKDRTIVLLSSLKDTFYQDFAKAKSALKKEIAFSNFYDENAYKIFHKGLFILIGIICLIIGILVLIFTPHFVTGIVLATLIIPAFIIHFSRPKKSEEGFKFLTKLKAFKEFLHSSPEQTVNEILDQDPAYFEKMLPYAVAFGLDKEWISRFETFNQEVPQWFYYGHNPGHANRASMSQFQSGFSIDTVQSVFKSTPEAPSTSSGSSFSGGSTGGGFGGGGGSSW